MLLSAISRQLYRLSVVLTPVISALLKIDRSSIGATNSVLLDFFDFLQSNSFSIFLIFPLLTLFTSLINSFIESNSKKESVKSILNDGRKHFFFQNHVDSDPAHYHRITLYQHKSFCLFPKPWRNKFFPWGNGGWPFSGWLVPYARSGIITQKVRSNFLVKDNGKAEGMAGVAWAHQKTILKSGLDHISVNATDLEIAKFAKESWVNPNWVNERKNRIQDSKPLCRSICGIPIHVDNKPWGVAVIDSTHPQSIVDPQREQARYMQFAFYIGTLLRKG